MKTTLTSEIYLKKFKEYCDEYNIMFIPDSPREEAISVQLLTYYKKNYDAAVLLETTKIYIRELGHKPAMVLNFSLVAHDYTDRVVENQKLAEEYRITMANTKKILEGK